MSRQKPRSGFMAARLIAAVVAIVLLVMVAILIIRGLTGLLNVFRSDGGTLERDPMFAEAPEQVTRPPDLYDEGTPPDWGEDPSSNWSYEELTPVDKTADELAVEAE